VGSNGPACIGIADQPKDFSPVPVYVSGPAGQIEILSREI
jgi:hypothetical protein